jgi:hypothetical protein
VGRGIDCFNKMLDKNGVLIDPMKYRHKASTYLSYLMKSHHCNRCLLVPTGTSSSHQLESPIGCRRQQDNGPLTVQHKNIMIIKKLKETLAVGGQHVTTAHDHAKEQPCILPLQATSTS